MSIEDNEIEIFNFFWNSFSFFGLPVSDNLPKSVGLSLNHCAIFISTNSSGTWALVCVSTFLLSMMVTYSGGLVFISAFSWCVCGDLLELHVCMVIREEWLGDYSKWDMYVKNKLQPNVVTESSTISSSFGFLPRILENGSSTTALE